MSKYKKIILSIIFILILINTIFLIYNLYSKTIDNSKSYNIESKLESYIESNVESNVESNIEVNKDSKVSLLKKENSDTVYYLKVNGTNIDYPVLKYSDNSYYLHHSFDKSESDVGWVFLDYRNSTSNLDRNNIIYAHARLDGSMFGTLRYVLSDKWLSDSSNYIISLDTVDTTLYFEVISVYYIPVTSDYLKVSFNNDDEFLEFENMLINRSMYNFNVTPNKKDKLLTLSTCKSNNQRYVLHARLIS